MATKPTQERGEGRGGVEAPRMSSAEDSNSKTEQSREMSCPARKSAPLRLRDLSPRGKRHSGDTAGGVVGRRALGSTAADESDDDSGNGNLQATTPPSQGVDIFD